MKPFIFKKEVNMIYELTCRYDRCKSFYHKAMVEESENKATLFSYDTPVARIENGTLTLLDDWDYSMTTRRHVKEFVRQNDVEDQYDSFRKEIRKAR